MELPDLKGREDILKVHAKKVHMSESVDFNAIARAAAGASGAELANIINEAALRAVRQNRKFVTQSDLEESVEVVIAGYQKKNKRCFLRQLIFIIKTLQFGELIMTWNLLVRAVLPDRE